MAAPLSPVLSSLITLDRKTDRRSELQLWDNVWNYPVLTVLTGGNVCELQRESDQPVCGHGQSGRPHLLTGNSTVYKQRLTQPVSGLTIKNLNRETSVLILPLQDELSPSSPAPPTSALVSRPLPPQTQQVRWLSWSLLRRSPPPSPGTHLTPSLTSSGLAMKTSPRLHQRRAKLELILWKILSTYLSMKVSKHDL